MNFSLSPYYPLSQMADHAFNSLKKRKKRSTRVLQLRNHGLAYAGILCLMLVRKWKDGISGIVRKKWFMEKFVEGVVLRWWYPFFYNEWSTLNIVTISACRNFVCLLMNPSPKHWQRNGYTYAIFNFFYQGIIQFSFIVSGTLFHWVSAHFISFMNWASGYRAYEPTRYHCYPLVNLLRTPNIIQNNCMILDEISITINRFVLNRLHHQSGRLSIVTRRLPLAKHDHQLTSIICRCNRPNEWNEWNDPQPN